MSPLRWWRATSPWARRARRAAALREIRAQHRALLAAIDDPDPVVVRAAALDLAATITAAWDDLP